MEVPRKITLLPLPPKYPESNVMENVWQFRRDNWVSNRVFLSYDHNVDHCSRAWHQFNDQPWRIMPIRLRGWAHPSWTIEFYITKPPITHETRAGFSAKAAAGTSASPSVTRSLTLAYGLSGRNTFRFESCVGRNPALLTGS